MSTEITNIPQGLIENGYVLLERGHPRRFKGYGTWEKDGVRVALSSNCLGVERGTVMIYLSDDDEMVVEAIITNADVRGQGRASKALGDVTLLADVLGTKLYLEPVQLEQGTGMSVSDLIEFYKSSGFLAQDRECKVMVRVPQQD